MVLCGDYTSGWASFYSSINQNQQFCLFFFLGAAKPAYVSYKRMGIQGSIYDTSTPYALCTDRQQIIDTELKKLADDFLA